MRRDEAAKRNIAPIEGDAVFLPVLCARGWVTCGQHHVALLLCVGRSCTPPTYTGMEANLHRRCNVQRTEAGAWKTACFVDLDARDDTARSCGMEIPTNLAPTVFGSGRGPRLVGDGGRDAQRVSNTGRQPNTVCLAGPGRAATTVCLLLEGSPMGSHLSKSHATCKPQRHRGWWSKRHGQPSRVDCQGACAPTTFSQCPFP
ncbi:hypothetical protein B0T18DRAFT_418509 [Schizothecium vesticola]|uniref:Uncharacterized protein n=1 Tax=Schizothecium vesticola TaxID=314040 RepID=A0AA40EJU1_9PEZI|nr:hypothetical protein B0T18DRAFT_418509 [Schizothecium vesticola]